MASRRDVILGGLGLLASRASNATAPLQQSAGPALIVRSMRPQNLETPVGLLDTDIVPVEAFFVRSHFGPPIIDEKSWRLSVTGQVDKTLSLTMDDLRKLPRVTSTSVLQCAGNGRALHRPRVAGAQWERGAVGQAKWTGVRLKDVLALAKPKSSARFVRLLGADSPPMPTTPQFARSVPLDKAMHAVSLLAHDMNDAPLHLLHGAPLRAVLPGWVGDDWIKWLVEIRVDDAEDAGFYQATAYRMPRIDNTMAPMTSMVVKSLITKPTEAQKLSTGPTAITGIAFAGEDSVLRVEVSTDGGKTWANAALEKSAGLGAWQRWHVAWTPAPGSHRILARATDSKGHVQPEVTPWNPSGYLWNAIDAVTCEVSA